MVLRHTNFKGQVLRSEKEVYLYLSKHSILTVVIEDSGYITLSHMRMHKIIIFHSSVLFSHPLVSKADPLPDTTPIRNTLIQLVLGAPARIIH